MLLLKFNSSIKKGHKYKLWTSAEISPNFDNLKGIPLDSYVIEEKITNEITLHFPLDQRSIFRAVILDELVDSTKKTYIMPLMYINYKIEVK